jgi:hypothetical protein
VVFAGSAPLAAQDFRVATSISRTADEGRTWQPVAHSLTLFHAGKVYDLMEAVGDLVVFEPLQSQFVVLSLNGNRVATRVRFEELHQFLKVARAELERSGKDLQQPHVAGSGRGAEMLAFQLAPQFEEAFDPTTGHLRMSSPLIVYHVETAQVTRPAVVQQYLQYADWAARLNFVLHPQTVFPEVRMAVNAALTRQERVPTQVTLQLAPEEQVRLRAEHTFAWKLHSFDKSSIQNWEQLRDSADVRWVDFREYQRIMLPTVSIR